MRHFVVVEPSYLAERLVAPGSRITDAWLNGAEPGSALVETDETGIPKDPADINRLLAAGVNLGPVQIAPVAPHAPNPTAAQAIPGQPAGSVQFAGDREYVPADGVESNESAAARVERLTAELAAAQQAAEQLDAASTTDLQPEPPRRAQQDQGGQQQEPGPLDQSVEKLTAHLETVTDPAEVDRLLAAERGGKSRTTAIEALEARKTTLAAPAG